MATLTPMLLHFTICRIKKRKEENQEEDNQRHRNSPGRRRSGFAARQ